MLEGLSFPAKLRVLRAQRGLTLIQAEEATGVTAETISELERGRRKAYMPTLNKIATGYGVPVEELLELEEPVLAGKAEGSVEGSGPGRTIKREVTDTADATDETKVRIREQFARDEIPVTNREVDLLVQYVVEGIQNDAPFALVQVAGEEAANFDRVDFLASWLRGRGTLSSDEAENVDARMHAKLVASAK